ncbi:MAG: rhodanese-like domain-containing protein, partial [Pseudomonadota bacterium]
MAIKSIDVAGLKKLIDSNDVVLIDVREPGEYNAENIEQATLIPLSQVSCSVLPEIGGKKLVIHCRSGKRSMAACERLFEEDH